MLEVKAVNHDRLLLSCSPPSQFDRATYLIGQQNKLCKYSIVLMECAFHSPDMLFVYCFKWNKTEMQRVYSQMRKEKNLVWLRGKSKTCYTRQPV